MSHLHNFALLVLIALLSTAGIQSQTRPDNTAHYDKDGVAFDYPADWKLTDSSTPDVLYLNITPQGGAAQIAVMAQLNVEEDCDFQGASKKAANALLEKLAGQIQALRPLQTSAVKTHVGVADFEGLQLHGQVNNRGVTGEVYSFRLKLRLVNLVYLRTDDETQGASGWELLRTSMKFDIPVFKATEVRMAGVKNTYILNGRALRLAKPDYPPIARLRRVSGTVVVQVVIDEEGSVISAKAISGDPLLHLNSVSAARDSKFSATKMCGEPVRVSGVVTYNFVAQ